MKNLLKRFIVWLVQGLLGLVLIGLLAIMLAEWFAGCGETYIDAKGVRHPHECLFINPPKENP